MTDSRGMGYGAFFSCASTVIAGTS